MSFKSNIATFAGKSSYWFLHNVLKGGTSFPGKLAMKLDPDVLEQLGKDYETIIVTGTNGKTMTTALITQTLKEKYGDILTNPSGSNMAQGIVTAFLAHGQKKSSRKLAVLEVDEANVKAVTQLVHPKAFVLTNIFRDQMDRYGEIYTTYEKIVAGIKLAPDATIIANGDASIFSSVDLPNPKVFLALKLIRTNRKMTSRLTSTLTGSSALSASISCTTTQFPMPTWVTSSARTAATSGRI